MHLRESLCTHPFEGLDINGVRFRHGVSGNRYRISKFRRFSARIPLVRSITFERDR